MDKPDRRQLKAKSWYGFRDYCIQSSMQSCSFALVFAASLLRINLVACGTATADYPWIGHVHWLFGNSTGGMHFVYGQLSVPMESVWLCLCGPITHHGIRFPVGQSPRTGSQPNTKPTDYFRSMGFSIMKSSRRPNKSLQLTATARVLKDRGGYLGASVAFLSAPSVAVAELVRWPSLLDVKFAHPHPAVSAARSSPSAPVFSRK